MLVKAHRDSSQRTGLHVGEANARRYFSKRTPSIELRLGDLRIQCTLSPDFWRDHPEIHDPRLNEWLEFKAGRRHGSAPMLFSLIPFGPDAFAVCPPVKGRYEAFGADVTHARTVQSESVLPQGFTMVEEEFSVA